MSLQNNLRVLRGEYVTTIRARRTRGRGKKAITFRYSHTENTI